MTMFATAQELRTLLTGETLATSPGVDDEWIAQAELLLELVSADIQAVARNRIIAGTDTARLAGTWSRDLVLPRRPVVVVTSVALNGTAIGATAYEWNERSLIRYAGDLDDDTGSHWGGPASTVDVVYGYGYEEADVPEFVKSLALRVAARTIDSPGGGVTQESLGPYSVTYGAAARAGQESGTYLTKAERKLLRHRFSRTAGTIHAGSL